MLVQDFTEIVLILAIATQRTFLSNQYFEGNHHELQVPFPLTLISFNMAKVFRLDWIIYF